MKVGSLVELIKPLPVHPLNKIALPALNTPYTVREIVSQNKNVGIRLEEIINAPAYYLEGLMEASFCIEYFREIEFPPSLTEEIEECLTKSIEPVLI